MPSEKDGAQDSRQPFTSWRPRTARDWTALHAALGGGPQLRRSLKVARNAGCRTVIIEHRYVDADYRSEFSAYWSQKFRHSGAFARRAHFFVEEVSDQQVASLEPTAGYIGYLVIRPIHLGVVGRTVLRPPREVARKDPVLTTITDPVSFFGTALNATGVPFYTQDGLYIRCAHAAAWMCHYTSYLRGLTARHTTADLVALAPPELASERRLPSDGLNDLQLQAVFTGLNTPALTYRIDMLPVVLSVDPIPPAEGKLKRTKKQRDLAAVTIITRYLRSGFPVLVGVPEHAFTLVGFYEREPGNPESTVFLACDDQVGPYEELDPFKNDTERGFWDMLMIPLPRRAWLTGEAAESDAYETLSNLRADETPLPGAWVDTARTLKRGELRLYSTLMLGRRYKERLVVQRRHEDAVRALRLAHLSQWVWVVEAVDEAARRQGEPAAVAEIVYDYTSSDYKPTRLALSHQFGTRIVPPDDTPRQVIATDPASWIAHIDLARRAGA